MNVRSLACLISLCGSLGLRAAPVPADLTWVKQGHPVATVIIPDTPYPIAVYAAQELVHHIRLATGATLPVVREAQAAAAKGPRIYVGSTRAAEAAGIAPGTPGDETFTLRSTDDALFIVGRDGAGHPLSTANVNSGTLWGTYEVLERVLHVHWLWPGDLGTDVPATATVHSPPFDETSRPPFVRRIVRPGLRLTETGAIGLDSGQAKAQTMGLAFSPEGLTQYARDLCVFLRRHRQGASSDPRPYTGHSFGSWWKRYGKDHPDWFQKLPEGDLAASWTQRFGTVWGAPANRLLGQRGPASPDQPDVYSMCVSNPELHQEIVRRWQEQRQRQPGATLRIGENDVLALCTCDACRALDDPQPTEAELAAMPPYVRRMYVPFNAGRRYALFWKDVYERARAVDTNAIVATFVYVNYFTCPKDVTLYPNIILSIVPWSGWWFPRLPAEQAWLRDQWQQWRHTGATLYYRPNYTWDGSSMPHVYAHQMADEFQFTARNGSIGTDFDSLNGQWAANGTTLYMLFRLHVRPVTDVETLLAEYYQAFGPAAPQVRAYFDFWEAHAFSNRVASAGIMSRNQANIQYTHLRAAHELYPTGAFDRAAAILQSAADAVKDADPRYAQRVVFLQEGLTHTRMTRDLAALFADQAAPEILRQHVEALIAFRRRTEQLDIADFMRAGDSEVTSFGSRFDFALHPVPKPQITITTTASDL